MYEIIVNIFDIKHFVFLNIIVLFYIPYFIK